MRLVQIAAVPGLALLMVVPANAQDDGGGMIQRFLQDKLSSAGREVRIRGFEGLLSGQASLAELTIADEEGVWLILRDARLDWSRAALLRGRLSVQDLSAGELIVVRRPIPAPQDDTIEPPKAEASGFSLPELPVAVRIDNVSIDRAEIDEAVIGVGAELSLDGSVRLEGGEGNVDISLDRLDAPGDQLKIAGGFSNETEILSVNLDLREAEGGLASTLLRLPGRPSLDLTISGEGPLDDFAAEIGLRTDGQDRITGKVTLQGSGDGGTSFAADIGGDVTPLVPERFHPFFGDRIELVANGTRAGDGGFDLTRLSLSAQALKLEGAASLGADGFPTRIDLTGNLGNADGSQLRLPVSGDGAYVEKADFAARYDAAQSEDWTLDGEIAGLTLESLRAETVRLEGGGAIASGSEKSVSGSVGFTVAGLEMTDDALAQAIGTDLSGTTDFRWVQGGALDVSRIALDGADYGLSADGSAGLRDGSLHLDGKGALRADDISRFSAISGQELTGQVTAEFSGQSDVLGGVFSLELDVEGDGLGIGQEIADRLLAEPVTISTAIRRDYAGTTLDRFALRSRAVTLDAAGMVGSGVSDIGFEAALTDVSLVVPQYEGAVTLSGNAKEEEPGDWRVALDLAGPYELQASVAGKLGKAGSDVDLDLSLPDIAPLAPGHSGAVALAGNVTQTGTGGWAFLLDGTGPYASDLNLKGTMGSGPGEVTFSAGLPDVSPLLPGVEGPLRAEGTASDAGDGLWKVKFDANGPLDSFARIDGVAGAGRSDLDLDLSLPDLAPLVPQLSGALTARGNAAEAGDGRWNVDLDLAGPYSSTAAVSGLVGATGTDVSLALSLPDVAPLAPGFTGAVDVSATAKQDPEGIWDLSADARGPYRSTITAGGRYGGGASDLTFAASLPDIAPLVPDMTGPVSVNGEARAADAGAWDVTLDAGLPYNGTAQVSGRVGAGTTAVDISVALPSVAPFAPGVSGAFQAQGTLAQSGDNLAVNLATNGPEGVSSNVSGTVAQNFSTVAINATGTAPLAVANRFIAPNAILGTARFDISVNGPPALQSVSGNVTVNGASLSLPTFQQRLDDIGVQVGVNGESLQLDARANSPAGGGATASGTLNIGTMAADIEARLDNFILTDPLLFRTILNGNVTVNGPLTGGGNIAGRIDVGRTEIRVPDGGLGFGGAIPAIDHINEPSAVHLTRKRAGLIEEERKARESSGASGPSFGLDVVVNAPDQIFIRGRGLDTEMGGRMRVTGTTSSPNPVGEIEVIRGRLDILGRRLDVNSGRIYLAGGLQPYIDLAASSSRDDFEFIVSITGPVDDPKFALASVPSLPQDEVLAHFLFGKGLGDLSPLQAVQLAQAVATLTGRGGPGLLGGVREGLGLDDLDLATSDDGGTEVRAGRYLTENVYTEFVADSDGGTEIDLNIDVNRNFTIRGSADSNGDSAIGIYFERDY